MMKNIKIGKNFSYESDRTTKLQRSSWKQYNYLFKHILVHKDLQNNTKGKKLELFSFCI